MGFVPEPQKPNETQEQRALRAIRSIFSGGDLAAESLQLSNEFTDRQVARLKTAVRGTRRPRPQG
ncbi:MAG: hypothetical protein JWP32_1962 [Schumannella sp.]|nr:hypothetical protein [Schumannella sp.]